MVIYRIHINFVVYFHAQHFLNCGFVLFCFGFLLAFLLVLLNGLAAGVERNEFSAIDAGNMSVHGVHFYIE